MHSPHWYKKISIQNDALTHFWLFFSQHIHQFNVLFISNHLSIIDYAEITMYQLCFFLLIVEFFFARKHHFPAAKKLDFLLTTSYFFVLFQYFQHQPIKKKNVCTHTALVKNPHYKISRYFSRYSERVIIMVHRSLTSKARR